MADCDDDDDDDEDYNKKLYFKSDWKPPRAPDLIENNITDFHEGLISRQSLLNKIIKPATNLTAVQQLILATLRNTIEFVILSTDKNLGPVIMEWKEYVFRMLEEHLCDGKDSYTNLTEAQAQKELDDLDSNMREILQEHEEDLKDHERV